MSNQNYGKLEALSRQMLDRIDLLEEDIHKLNTIMKTSIIMDKVPLPEPMDDRDGDGIPF
jgi:hypothetical protein